MAMSNRFRRKIGSVSLGFVLAGSLSLVGDVSGFTKDGSMAFTMQSQSFSPGAEIPAKFTCSGEDISPQLFWSEPPAGTASFALIMKDPDATSGDFTHWVVYQIPASARELIEGASGGANLPKGTLQGRNDFGRSGYGGPCPPPGKPHRYIFTLFALKTALTLPAGASRSEVEKALPGHIAGQAELTGRFGR